MSYKQAGGTICCEECHQPMLYIYDKRARRKCHECGGEALWDKPETDRSTKIPPFPYGRYST